MVVVGTWLVEIIMSDFVCVCVCVYIHTYIVF